jgi:hypothetical protein
MWRIRIRGAGFSAEPLPSGWFVVDSAGNGYSLSCVWRQLSQVMTHPPVPQFLALRRVGAVPRVGIYTRVPIETLGG